MKRAIAVVLMMAMVVILGATSSAWAGVIAVSLVGDAGNANDTSGLGGVSYNYYIGTYDVTNDQYVEFLNAVDPTGANALGLYNTNMTTYVATAGIDLTGTNPVGSKYSVKTNMGNKPVTFVSPIDSMRFVNWYANGQGAADTEDGTYTLVGGGTAPTATGVRNAGSDYFLPTRDEWYKAAHYDPINPGADATGAQGHGTDYWDYPTQSDTLPTSATADAIGDVSNPGANVANYNSGASWGGGVKLTTVGTAGNTTYYGAYDMRGNAANWMQGEGGTYYEAGSSALGDIWAMQGGIWNGYGSTSENAREGFRIASLLPAEVVPEPAGLGLVGLALLAVRRRRS